jgi:hypothetical protein
MKWALMLLALLAVLALLIFINSARMAVALCSLSDRPKYTKYSWKSMEDYCRKHDYDFVTEKSSLDTDRHTAWSKILLMDQTFDKGYDVVIWIDDDIMITEPDVPVSDVFKEFFNSDAKIAVARDAHGELANTGIICVKREGRGLLRKIYDDGITKENRWDQLWDQTAFNTMYESMKSDVYLYPPSTIQGFYRNHKDPDEFKWREGTWAAHMAGCDEKERIERMETLASRPATSG